MVDNLAKNQVVKQPQMLVCLIAVIEKYAFLENMVENRASSQIEGFAAVVVDVVVDVVVVAAVGMLVFVACVVLRWWKYQQKIKSVWFCKTK